MTESRESNLKATWVGGFAEPAAALSALVSPATAGPPLSTGDTLAGVGATLAAPIEGFADEEAPGPTLGNAGTTMARTAVLPRRQRGAPSPGALRSRFDRVRLLGEGAMGAVELARDNDIRRTVAVKRVAGQAVTEAALLRLDRKSTRLNSSHLGISYAVFCLKKKKKQIT